MWLGKNVSMGKFEKDIRDPVNVTDIIRLSRPTVGGRCRLHVLHMWIHFSKYAWNIYSIPYSTIKETKKKLQARPQQASGVYQHVCITQVCSAKW